jgi:hypothetical protein
MQADRQTDGQTDMTKLIIAFRNFANSHKTAVLLFVLCGRAKTSVIV